MAIEIIYLYNGSFHASHLIMMISHEMMTKSMLNMERERI